MKKTLKAIITIGACGFLIACSSNNKPRKVADVEYARPVHVSNGVNSLGVSPQSLSSVQTVSSKPQVGVIKPYAQVAGSSSTHSQAGVIKPYVEDAGHSVAPVRYAPVDLSADSYQVKAGDTLYSIAFRYGKDYREVARNNNIDVPYNISVGQVIYLNGKNRVSTPASNIGSSKIYVVKRGDTAVSVARTHGLTLSELARANQLSSPYTLEVGQKLNLDKNTVIASEKTNPKLVPVAGADENKAAEGNTKVTAGAAPAAVAVSEKVSYVSGKSASVRGVSWMWPARGRVIRNFSSTNKGIDIAGTRGQNVNASAAGQVVYSGNALRGYGNLIIINHNNEFLSAYAHNDMLLVKEGQKVKKGQVIAKMGSTDASQVMLHFEIRYKGNSVNPRDYLPK